MSQDYKYELALVIESYFAILSKIYQRDGKNTLLQVIVNATITVSEHWDDDWNGREVGHAVFLTVPENLYIQHVNDKTVIQSDIRTDLNQINTIHNEYISAVFLEFPKEIDSSWREQSGAMLTSRARVIQEKTQDRIWEPDCYRLFLSHKTEDKVETAKLKSSLRKYGVSCFVAHEDIHPTKEWQNEIENALFSMDALVALMTKDFHNSFWTDQELGVAIGRGVPVISVKLGRDPYGFIGKYQALKCSWEESPLEIAKLLMVNEKMKEAYIQALSTCSSFSDGNALADLLPHLNNLTAAQIATIITAYNTNGQVSSSYGFNGRKPRLYGDGLSAHLKRLTGKDYSDELSY